MELSNNNKAAAEAAPQNFFTGSVPRNYDTYMGPMLLEPFALDIVERVRVSGDVLVLELAAGTGRVTKPLLAALPEAHITATDISEDMMDVAREHISAPNLVWQNVNMADVPFPDNSFELVICQFGVMFVPDKLQALREMYRVLKPGGQLLFNTWGDIAQNPVWLISFQLFNRTFGQLPMPKELGPFGLTDKDQVIDLLQQAGFSGISGTKVHKVTVIESAAAAANGFLVTQPILRQKPELFPEMLKTLTGELTEKLGTDPLKSPLMALVFEATK